MEKINVEGMVAPRRWTLDRIIYCLVVRFMLEPKPVVVNLNFRLFRLERSGSIESSRKVNSHWGYFELNLTLNCVRLGVIDRFTYLRICVSNDDDIGFQSYTNLPYLWRKGDFSLPVKGYVYKSTVDSILLYECVTWPLNEICTTSNCLIIAANDS